MLHFSWGMNWVPKEMGAEVAKQNRRDIPFSFLSRFKNEIVCQSYALKCHQFEEKKF